MSKQNFLKFRKFYRLTVEKASDDDMQVIFAALATVCAKMVQELSKEKKDA